VATLAGNHSRAKGDVRFPVPELPNTIKFLAGGKKLPTRQFQNRGLVHGRDAMKSKLSRLLMDEEKRPEIWL
jgi:hypothetical protein